jgi:hypothetical protein
MLVDTKSAENDSGRHFSRPDEYRDECQWAQETGDFYFTSGDTSVGFRPSRKRLPKPLFWLTEDNHSLALWVRPVKRLRWHWESKQAHLKWYCWRTQKVGKDIGKTPFSPVKWGINTIHHPKGRASGETFSPKWGLPVVSNRTVLHRFLECLSGGDSWRAAYGSREGNRRNSPCGALE